MKQSVEKEVIVKTILDEMRSNTIVSLINDVAEPEYDADILIKQEELAVELLMKRKEIDVYDALFGYDIHIVFPEEITEEYIKSLIYLPNSITQKYGFTIDEIAKILYDNLEVENFLTLRKLIIFSSEEELLIAKEETYKDTENVECQDILTYGLIKDLGALGYTNVATSVCYVDLENIENSCKRFMQELHEVNFEECLYEEFYVTIFHELRHQMLECGFFLPEDIWPIKLQHEEYVEYYARDMYDIIF